MDRPASVKQASLASGHTAAGVSKLAYTTALARSLPTRSSRPSAPASTAAQVSACSRYWRASKEGSHTLRSFLQRVAVACVALLVLDQLTGFFMQRGTSSSSPSAPAQPCWHVLDASGECRSLRASVLPPAGPSAVDTPAVRAGVDTAVLPVAAPQADPLPLDALATPDAALPVAGNAYTGASLLARNDAQPAPAPSVAAPAYASSYEEEFIQKLHDRMARIQEAILKPNPPPQATHGIAWGVHTSLSSVAPQLKAYMASQREKGVYGTVEERFKSKGAAVPTPHPSRSEEEVRERSKFSDECRYKGQPWPRPLRVRGVTAEDAVTDYNTLRAHAFDLFDATDAYRQSGSYARWAQYAGPWIENFWSETYARPVVRVDDPTAAAAVGLPEAMYVPHAGGEWWAQLESAAAAGLSVRVEPFDFDLFYPYVPLFIRWTDLQVNAGFDPSVASLMIRRLYPVMRKDVQYITLVQYADGVYLRRSVLMRSMMNNMIVIAAGGTGNVPIPLLAQEHECDEVKKAYKHTYSFMGSMHSGPRSQAVQSLQRIAVEEPGRGIVVKDGDANDGDTWVQMMHDTMHPYAPRGTGLTSFRLYEALQMCHPPIYVHTTPWLPYKPMDDEPARASTQDVWSDIAFVVHVDNVERLMRDDLDRAMMDTSAYAQRYARMRDRLAALRDSYFTMEGVMAHVHRFLAQPRTSELFCVPRT